MWHSARPLYTDAAYTMIFNAEICHIFIFKIVNYVIFKDTYSEGHFKVLSAPDIHARVVGAYLIKVVPVDGKKSTSHRG